MIIRSIAVPVLDALVFHRPGEIGHPRQQQQQRRERRESGETRRSNPRAGKTGSAIETLAIEFVIYIVEPAAARLNSRGEIARSSYRARDCTRKVNTSASTRPHRRDADSRLRGRRLLSPRRAIGGIAPH